MVAKGAITWPLAIPPKLVSACSSLRDLAILNLRDTAWLKDVGSPTLETLLVGPHHDVLDLHPDTRLQVFTSTSILTFEFAQAWKEIILGPSIRVFRNWVTSVYEAYPFTHQLEFICETTSIEKAEIVM